MSSGNGRRIHFGGCRADAGLVKTASYFLVLCPLASFAAGYFSLIFSRTDWRFSGLRHDIGRKFFATPQFPPQKAAATPAALACVSALPALNVNWTAKYDAAASVFCKSKSSE